MNNELKFNINELCINEDNISICVQKTNAIIKDLIKINKVIFKLKNGESVGGGVHLTSVKNTPKTIVINFYPELANKIDNVNDIESILFTLNNESISKEYKYKIDIFNKKIEKCN